MQAEGSKGMLVQVMIQRTDKHRVELQAINIDSP